MDEFIYTIGWLLPFTQILTEVAIVKKKIVNQRWRYKSKLETELESNFTFKWFANVDVKFGMNVVNDHSWKSYTPADH